MIHKLDNGAQVRVEDISYLSELYCGNHTLGFRIIFKSGADISSSLKFYSLDEIESHSYYRKRNKDDVKPERTNLYYEDRKPDVKEIAFKSFEELSFFKRFQNNYNELLAKFKELE